MLGINLSYLIISYLILSVIELKNCNDGCHYIITHRKVIVARCGYGNVAFAL